MTIPDLSPEQRKELGNLSDAMILETAARKEDQQAMDMLAELIPAIIGFEEIAHGKEKLPLRLYHSMEAKIGGHVIRGADEYFINFDMHGNKANSVLSVSLLQGTDGVHGDGFDSAELSIIYNTPEHISTMTTRGNLSLMDFAMILGDYLETQEAKDANS